MRYLAITSLLFSFLLIVLSWNQTFRLDTDYDSNFPMFHRYIPGDPLSSIWNPVYSVPVLIFGTEYGFRITIVLVIMLSSIAMWLLLTSLRVTGVTRMWGSLLYATAGTLGARIAAGHIEKVLSYPFVPIFFLALFQKRGLLAGIVAAAAFLSGDVYLAWFFLLFWVVSLRKIGLFVISFILFSSPKLLPFIFHILPTMERFFPINYSEGSIHGIFASLAFVVPWQTGFYDKPLFQRLIGFHFNWNEYFAFVSPLPFVFLLQKRIWKNQLVRHIALLLVIGTLYVSLGYPYSPFYWLFKFIPALQIFRVPQRIFFPMTTLVIVLFALAVDTKQKFTKLIMALSLLWTTVVFTTTFVGSFEPPRILEANIAKQLRSLDNSTFSVANFVCCIQTFLIREQIGIVNYYYGWRPKSAPNFINTDGNGFNYSALRETRPKYIIAKSKDIFTEYGYAPFFSEGSIQVWKIL